MAEWPHQNVSDPGPDSATYSPTYTPESPSLSGMAYAGYAFDIPHVSSIFRLKLYWATGGNDYTNLWLGIANFTNSTWDWFAGSSDDILEFPSDNHVHEGQVWALVLCLGEAEWELTALELQPVGGGGMPGQPDSPMFGYNAQHTRLSPFIGPQTNNRLWSYDMGTAAHSSPTIAADGTVYTACGDLYPSGATVYAINPDGTLKWRYLAGYIEKSSPAIGEDGTVYVGSYNGYLYALRPDNGTLKWRYNAVEGVDTCPAIGADGTIYIADITSKIIAIFPDGNLKWSYETDAINGIESSPAVAEDGTVYATCLGDNLHAINSNGTSKWRYEIGWSRSSPAIDANGIIYVGSLDGYLYALYPNGTLKWKYFCGDDPEATIVVTSSPAIAADGTIYVGSGDCYVYAINPDGTFKWRFKTSAGIEPSPAIGADGSVYIGSYEDSFYAIKPDGTLKWSYITGYVDASAAIGSNRRLYIVNLDGKLLCFGPES